MTFSGSLIGKLFIIKRVSQGPIKMLVRGARSGLNAGSSKAFQPNSVSFSTNQQRSTWSVICMKNHFLFINS